MNGLEGVVAAETKLSMVDGERGELIIAGYAVEELAPNATFEETVELLWGRPFERGGELPQMTFDDERPSFYLLNTGETHYPYALPDEDPSRWPRLSGVHGVFKNLDEQTAPGEPAFFDDTVLAELRDRQIEAVRYLDGVVARLFDMVPKNTHVIITSDHGELFGEDGYFGHGPIAHDKVFEVPFVEGLVP